MKRKIAIVFLAFLISAFACGISVQAAEVDDILDEFESIIPSETGVDLDTEDVASAIGIESVLNEILLAVSGKAGEFLSFFMLLFGFSVVLSITDNTSLSQNAELRNTSAIAVLTLASVSIFSALYSLAEGLRDGLSSVADFFSAAIPVLTAISVGSGAPSTATTQALNMNVTLAVMERFSISALLPIAFAIFTLSFIGSLGEGGGIGGVARGIKSVFTWGVGIISTALAAIVSIQSVVASAHDSAVLRAARYAASGTIPIVGSTVASALATLGGGMAFIKGAVGGASVAVILSLSLAPLVALLLYRLAFTMCTTFLEFSGSTGGVRCFSAFKSALDALIAVYSMSVLVCIVELIVFIKGGVGA